MQCPRCDGEMSYEMFEDLKDDTGDIYFYGWRCIICGEILDPVIISNRENKMSPIVGRNRKIMGRR